MRDRTLSICKPSFNRKEVLVSDIKEYLSCDDDRFEIHVSDNHSTDGTIEKLNRINDPRLKVVINDENIGGIPNIMQSLSNSGTEYVLLLLDKDTCDVKYLPEFIDYLEKETPNFGYVDLKNIEKIRVENHKACFDSVINTGFLSKHPSGFFWKAELFDHEIKQKYYTQEDPYFAFIFDIICGHLGVKYDSQILFMPFVLNANIRTNLLDKNSEANKTFEYRGEDKVFFGIPKRIHEFEIYIKNAIMLNLPQEEKKVLCKKILESGICNVTVGARWTFRNKAVCDHYCVEPRNVGLLEMIGNAKKIISIFKKETANDFAKYASTLSLQLLVKSILRDIECLVIDVFRKPESGMSA